MLQRQICRLHDVQGTPLIDAFVIGDKQKHALLGDTLLGDEHLIVRQSAENTPELALYLSDALTETLSRYDPVASLNCKNFAALLDAIEGVSHFVVVSWHLQEGREVSALEMEVQAEIDKFVVMWLWHQTLGDEARYAARARALCRQMFDRWSLATHVRGDERDRYIMASRAAHAFIRDIWSLPQGSAMPQVPQVMREVGRFVRLPLSVKLRRAG